MSREFVCEECQNSTLDKLESMLEILQTDTKQGTVTPTEIADNILNIMGKSQTHSIYMHVRKAFREFRLNHLFHGHGLHSNTLTPEEHTDLK